MIARWVSLLAFLGLCGLVSCEVAAEPVALAAFSSDGCSLFPDGTFKERNKWCGCCQEHDIAYWQGGTVGQRLQADEALRACVVERTGDENLAEAMYLGVRGGGHPVFPTWYRWGYGWSYGRGYEALTEIELRRVRELLDLYNERHPGGYCGGG